jgi:hypothetical protein
MRNITFSVVMFVMFFAGLAVAQHSADTHGVGQGFRQKPENRFVKILSFYIVLLFYRPVLNILLK